jgi:hypothetical protein
MRPIMPSLLALFLMAAAREGGAQALPEPPPLRLPAGARARVFTRALPDRTIEGRIVSADTSAVTLVPEWADPFERREMTVPTSDVMSLEVTFEKKRHWWQGALIGAAAGALLGLASDIDPALCQANNDVFCSRGEAIAAGAGGGAILGGAIGFFVETDRWTPVALDTLGPPVRATGERSSALSFRATVRF